MARTPAGFPGGVRIPDYLPVNVIAQVYPHDTVGETLRLTDSDSLRRRDLPAEVMVYYVIAMAFFRAVSAGRMGRPSVDSAVRTVRHMIPAAGRTSGQVWVETATRRRCAGEYAPRRDPSGAQFPQGGNQEERSQMVVTRKMNGVRWYPIVRLPLLQRWNLHHRKPSAEPSETGSFRKMRWPNGLRLSSVSPDSLQMSSHPSRLASTCRAMMSWRPS